MACLSVFGRSVLSAPALLSSSPQFTIDQKVTHIVRAISAKSPHQLTRQWKEREVLHLEPKVLDTLLQKTIEELMLLEDPASGLQALASIFPLQQLEAAVKTQFPQHQDALSTARAMVKSAKAYLAKTEATFTTSFKTQVQGVLTQMLEVLESFIAAFGVGEFFKPVEDRFDGEIKAQKIMMIISLFTLLVSLLTPVLGAEVCALVVGGALLSLIVLSIVYPKIRPTPSHLPLGENWSAKYAEGKLSPMPGRAHIVSEIVHTLTANTQVKKHPLLVGPSGIGKTETGKAFVEAVERGDFPELAGKKVIYFNTANLAGNKDLGGGGNKVLFRIKEEIKGHEQDVILIFDEIHLASRREEGATNASYLGEQLKTLLDPGVDKFAYVIGITTEEEYLTDIYKSNPPLARRFKPISIKSTTPDETLEALDTLRLKEAPHILVEKGALRYLAGRFPNIPQPLKSIDILQQCIDRTNQFPRTALDERVQVLRQQIQSFYLEQGTGAAIDLLPYEDRTEIERIEQELSALEGELTVQQATLNHFFERRKKLAEIKTHLFKSVFKVAHLQEGVLGKKGELEAKTFLLMSHYLTPLLEGWVRKEAIERGVETVINKELIDLVIAENEEKEKRRELDQKEAIAKKVERQAALA